jgi:hypothetical protein
MTTPTGWRVIRLGDAAALAVPPDAHDLSVQPVDSIFGVLRGDAYEVMYDYGRSGEQLAAYEDRPGYTRRSRTVDGRAGTEVSFQANEKPRGVIRILQAQDGRNVLTVRVSCVNDDTCRLADSLFDSVRFKSS